MEMTRYHPDFTRALDGDVAASMMLSQIAYWYMPDEHGKSKLRVFRFGKWWLVKSFRDWEDELGLSQKQSGRCLQVLRNRGLIVTEVGKFYSDTVTHIRLVGLEGNATLKCPEDLFKIANETFQNCLKDIPLTETTTGTTTETTTASEPAPPLAYAAAATATPTPTPEAVPPTPLPPSPPEGLAASAKGVLKSVLAKQGMKESGVPIKNSFVTLWQQVRASTTGKYQVNLTAKERGQLKKIADAIGPDASKVIRWTLENWVDFAYAAKFTDGIKVAPQAPSPAFLLTHVNTAYGTWQEYHKIIPTTHEVAPTPKPNPKPKPAPKPPVPLGGPGNPVWEAQKVAYLKELAEQQGK